MYRIKVCDVEANGTLTEMKDDNRRYQYKEDAKTAMIKAMVNALNMMVEVSHEKELYSNSFTIDLDATVFDEKYDGVLRLWNVPSDIINEPFTLYKIEWVNEAPEDEFNKKLKDTYGDSITLWIYSELVEDDDIDVELEEEVRIVEQYYFEGARCPRSENYEDPYTAYKLADEYMRNIDLYADC